MDQIWEAIQLIAENNGGVIRTSEVEQAGFSRPMLKKYVNLGKLERVRKGIYILSNGIVDEFVLLQAQNSKIIFSYGTALYLWGMSDRVPHFWDITVPHGTKTAIIRRDNDKLRCHYVKPELYQLGITQTRSPQSGTVWLYDKERCICDLIRDKEKIDLQLYSQAVKEYFKSEANARKILKYGKAFHIEKKIRSYMEIFL